MKLIAQRVWNADQSWHFVHTVDLAGHVLRVSIRRNAYDDQSFARVERHDGAKWQPLTDWPISLCACRAVHHLDKKVDDAAFAADDRGLLAEAAAILKVK